MYPARRRYLRYISGASSVLLGGLAGCIGSNPSETPPSETDDAGNTRPSGTGGPGVRIVSTDEDVDLPIRPTVELVRDAATSEQPPRLETTLTNTSDEPVSVGEGRAVHFEYVTNDSGALILLPGESGREYPSEPDCWRLTEGIAVTEEYQTFEIEAGASSNRLVDLYATPEVDGCLPVGEYRFETTISIMSTDAEPASSATWGFSLSLE